METSNTPSRVGISTHDTSEMASTVGVFQNDYSDMTECSLVARNHVPPLIPRASLRVAEEASEVLTVLLRNICAVPVGCIHYRYGYRSRLRPCVQDCQRSNACLHKSIYLCASCRYCLWTPYKALFVRATHHLCYKMVQAPLLLPSCRRMQHCSARDFRRF